MSSTNRHRPPQTAPISFFYLFFFPDQVAFPSSTEITRVANYLNIKELLDLVCETIADMNKEKTPEENPQNVEHKNDFIPKEEDVHMENAWAFEIIIACLFCFDYIVGVFFQLL
ncbi:hypothetical protein E3N88_32606 [Mikania micrantha]|uniref:SKP1 component dimerisation domain-containing protein n=1 Tax=Mikania micrantha TaxID=192012 RepID=A0A5N6M9I3_9ASTR|nr:hypothetical protein E3N88_32606 [Mikania micrantha]